MKTNPTPEDKLLWMDKSLEKEWKSDPINKRLQVLLSLASTTTKFSLKSLIPSAIPTSTLDKAGKSVAGKVGELVYAGDGIFDSGEVAETETEKKILKEGKALYKSVGEGAFLVVWAAFGSAAPYLAGIVLVTAVLKYAVNIHELHSKKRWEEITASMMAKYEKILKKVRDEKVAEAQKERDFLEAVQKVREEEFETEKKEDEACLAVVPSPNTNKPSSVQYTYGASIRLASYLFYILSVKVDNAKVTTTQFAQIYASLQKDVDGFSANSLVYQNGKLTPDQITHQKEVVSKILDDEKDDEIGSDADELPGHISPHHSNLGQPSTGSLKAKVSTSSPQVKMAT